MTEPGGPRFAVFAEAATSSRPLIVTGLTFALLIDDVVQPYDGNEPFFLDGVPLTKDRLHRIKIVQETGSLQREVALLHWKLQRGSDPRTQKILGEQYHIRLEAILRDSGEDVTGQIFKAFAAAIRPHLEDYVTHKETLIRAAMTEYIEQKQRLSNPSA